VTYCFPLASVVVVTTVEDVTVVAVIVLVSFGGSGGVDEDEGKIGGVSDLPSTPP
jgi:hypothetical protein